MQPYYKAWETSKHFGKAKCVDCHYPPAESLREHFWHKFQASSQVIKYVTQTYSSKPFAEVEDASCLRSGCHAKRLLEGRIISEKGIKFDHQPHLIGNQHKQRLRCVSCHSQVVVGRHFEVTYSSCFLCHFRGKGKGHEREPVGGCLSCHDIPDESFQLGTISYRHGDFVTKRGVACRNCHLDIVQGTGLADKDRCVNCHNQPEKISRYDDVPFIHKSHIEMRHVACLHCHEEMHHSLQKEVAQGTPRPTMAFECSFCHESKHMGQLEMYTGKVGHLGLPEMPSPMYLANVDCIGCHYDDDSQLTETEFMGRTVRAVSASCIKCHGPTFEGIWDETEKVLTQTLAKMGEKLKKARAALEKASLKSSQREELEGMFRKVKRWEQFVRTSRGEHNIYLASTTFRKMDRTLEMIGKELAIKLPDLSSLPLLSGRYCGPMCHSKVGVDVPPKTVTVKSWGMDMPHDQHTKDMSCVTCHQIGAHKDATLIEGIEDSVCSKCH